MGLSLFGSTVSLLGAAAAALVGGGIAVRSAMADSGTDTQDLDFEAFCRLLAIQPAALPNPEPNRPDNGLDFEQFCRLLSINAVAELPQQLNQLSFHQWVTADADGNLRVQLVGSDGWQMVTPVGVELLLVHRSAIVQARSPDSDGAVVFDKPRPGVYQLVISSSGIYGSLPISLLARSAGPGLPDVVRMPVIVPARAAISDRLAAGTLPIAAEETPGQFDRDPLGPHRVAGSSLIMAAADGSLRGQLSMIGQPVSKIDMTGMQVAVLRDGQVVAQAPVAVDGTFRVIDLPGGSYGLLAYGPQGGAAVAFEFTDRKRSVLPGSADERLIVVQSGSSLNVECCSVGFDAPLGGGAVDFLGRGCGTCCSGGGQSLLKGRGLLLGAIAAGISIPIAVGDNPESSPVTPEEP
jgi:hypothetical protein